MRHTFRTALTLLTCCAAVLLATSSAQAAFGPQFQIGSALSNFRPAVVNFRGTLYAIYTHAPDDPNMYYTTSTDGTNWTPERFLGAPTSDAPAAVVFQGRLYVIYKSHLDNHLWYKSSPDGADWNNELNHPLGGGGGSTSGLSATVFANQLHVVWKGIDPDQAMYMTTSADGVNWTDQIRVVGDGGTSSVPAIASYHGFVFLAWKGIFNDDRIFWSSSQDGLHFAPQSLGVGRTSDGPALDTPFGEAGALHQAWKGTGSDPRMFEATMGAALVWSDQFQVGGGTSARPSIGDVHGSEVLAWKGVPGDKRLFDALNP